MGQAGSTMDEVVASVRRVTDIVGEISLANSEQSGGIEQINIAITEMDHVTQQNAALVEQAAAAANSLDQEANGLSRAVGIFRFDTAARPGSRASAGARKAAPSGSRELAVRARAVNE